MLKLTVVYEETMKALSIVLTKHNFLFVYCLTPCWGDILSVYNPTGSRINICLFILGTVALHIWKSLLTIQSTKCTGSCPIFCELIKYATGLGCMLGFIPNSYIIFDEYNGGKTLLSSDLPPSTGGHLMAPGILICSSRAYKTKSLVTDMADYKKNTMALDDFLIAAYYLDSDSRDVNSMDKLFKPIYTPHYGTCYSLNTRFWVSKFMWPCGRYWEQFTALVFCIIILSLHNIFFRWSSAACSGLIWNQMLT